MRNRKYLISLLSLMFFVSCSTIIPTALDILSNKIITDKDAFFQSYIKISKELDDLIPKFSYNLKWYKYKESLFYKYKKMDSKNLVLYVHGGAFLDTKLSSYYLRAMERVLDNSKEGFEIIFLDERGEHFPKQSLELDDVLDYSMTKYDNIVIMGDSSGGNVILSNLLMRKDKNKKMPDAVVLISPWTDLTNTVDSRKRNFYKDILFGKVSYPKTLMDNSYVKGEDTKNPYVSPIFGDYKDFPKTYIQVGADELLTDDSVVLYENMKKAKVNVKIDVYDKMFHVFQLFGMRESKDALMKISKYIDGVYYDKGVKNQ